MMTTNLFVIANVKQLRTGGSFRILLPFFQTSWGVGVLNSAIFNSFHNWVEFWHDFGGPSEFRGGLNPPNPPPGTPLLQSGCIALCREWKERAEQLENVNIMFRKQKNCSAM